jgi:hypothetical protein
MLHKLVRKLSWTLLFVTFIAMMTALTTAITARRALAGPICCDIPPTENCSGGEGKLISGHCYAGIDPRCQVPFCW